MTTHPRSSNPAASTRYATSAQRLPHDLVRSGLERLITVGNPKLGAARLYDRAHEHGIDLDLLWGVVDRKDPKRPFVRQVCMVVPGAGSTGMCFLSAPARDPRLGESAAQVLEIGAALDEALEQLPVYAGERVTIAQCLLETDLTWAHKVCTSAQMIGVGTLDYMRMPWSRIGSLSESGTGWPEGVCVKKLSEIPERDRDTTLIKALDGSYEDTLDCPELCGLRSVEQILESHRATGVFDPSSWWVVFKDNQPSGCCLLTHCPASDAVELVYIGLSKRVRGLGLGKRVLAHALRTMRQTVSVRELTCAVDRRNKPAQSMYSALGMRVFDARVGFVAPVPRRS